MDERIEVTDFGYDIGKDELEGYLTLPSGREINFFIDGKKLRELFEYGRDET